MPDPGDEAGDCPRCGHDRVLVGYENTVVGAHCDTCELTVTLEGDAMSVREARQWVDWAEERES